MQAVAPREACSCTRLCCESAKGWGKCRNRSRDLGTIGSVPSFSVRHRPTAVWRGVDEDRAVQLGRHSSSRMATSMVKISRLGSN